VPVDYVSPPRQARPGDLNGAPIFVGSRHCGNGPAGLQLRVEDTSDRQVHRKERNMSKSQDAKKTTRKKPLKTLLEKRAEKRAKKLAR
jgi:hypothetical protein